SEFGRGDVLIERLVTFFHPRIAEAAEFAKQSRILLLKTNAGVGIDIALGALPYESRMIQRSTEWVLDETRMIRTCSAEDLVIQKTFAGRDQDWVDVQCIIQRQTVAALDCDMILRELGPLLELKGELESLHRLQAMVS